MAVTVDPTLLPDDSSVTAPSTSSACFNCGNCTAVCPLTDDDATFPRRLIRYAQVGMKEELLASKELWTCYYCGECSETCPRQAEPGEFMAAARRYAIASYDRTRLASDDVSPASPRRQLRRAARGRLRRLHVRRPRPAGRHDAGALRVHPSEADPLPRPGGDGRGRRGRARRPRRRWSRRIARSEGVGLRTIFGGRAPLSADRAGAPSGSRSASSRSASDAIGPTAKRRRSRPALVSAALAPPRADDVGLPGPASARRSLDYGLELARHQGHRHPRPDLVSGPPARHRRRRHARLRRDDAHPQPPPARPIGRSGKSNVGGLDAPVAAVAHRGQAASCSSWRSTCRRPRPGATGCSSSTWPWRWSWSCWPRS